MRNFSTLLKKTEVAMIFWKKIPSLPFGLYSTYIKPVPHVAYKVFFQNVDAFKTWHERLGHPVIGTMRKIMSNCICHNLNDAKFPKSWDFMCTACAIEKLILRASPLKIHTEPLKFLERIQGDICAPILPLSGSFRYFMVLVNASTRWLHVFVIHT
jgi:hypothetical protein